MFVAPATAGADDLLGQRSRARLLARLRELRRPGTTAELAEAVSLHPNGVRVQLAKLQTAGLVGRSQSEGRRGRLADLWAASPSARVGGQARFGYRDLAGFLARAIGLDAGCGDMRAAGREIGRDLASPLAVDAADSLEYALAAMGCAPERVRAERGRTVLRLGNCPDRAVGAENEVVICALHRGITEGLLDVLMPDAELREFIAGSAPSGMPNRDLRCARLLPPLDFAGIQPESGGAA